MDLFDIFKERNGETEDEQKNRVAEETIDSVLIKFKDKERFYSDLDKTGRDIIHHMITHEDEDKVLLC